MIYRGIRACIHWSCLPGRQRKEALEQWECKSSISNTKFSKKRFVYYLSWQFILSISSIWRIKKHIAKYNKLYNLGGIFWSIECYFSWLWYYRCIYHIWGALTLVSYKVRKKMLCPSTIHNICWEFCKVQVDALEFLELFSDNFSIMGPLKIKVLNAIYNSSDAIAHISQLDFHIFLLISHFWRKGYSKFWLWLKIWYEEDWPSPDALWQKNNLKVWQAES